MVYKLEFALLNPQVLLATTRYLLTRMSELLFTNTVYTLLGINKVTVTS